MVLLFAFTLVYDKYLLSLVFTCNGAVEDVSGYSLPRNAGEMLRTKRDRTGLES